MTRAVFAIPGDKDQRTGGYIYDATVLRVLNESGCAVAHLELPDSFPTPPPEDTQTALKALAEVPAICPIIVDGLALGAMPPEGVASIDAPVIAMVHHPLGLETGMASTTAKDLIQNEAAVLEHVAHVIVPSPHIAGTLTSDFGVSPDRVTVASPGFARACTPQMPMWPPLVLSVGLLAHRKGHDVLIEALDRISDLPWKAEIIGRRQEPAYTRALETQISEARLTTRITLCGEVDSDTMHAAYRRASLFALATRYEGYGMVLSEAMLHGLPVVSCAVGAVPGTVGDAGHLVPPNDPSAFSTVLRGLLGDPERAAAAAQASAAHAANLSTWADTAQHFANVIAQVTP